ncbi:MAG: glycoside hydrolase, partial [Actinobacteria bacterium]|nr:glycoside hydrolase [Actinomycetota bacterium]
GAEGNSHVVVTATCGGTLSSFFMPNWQTWGYMNGPYTIATSVLWGGKPAFSPANGNDVYLAYTTSSDLWVAHSADGGQTWISSHIATTGTQLRYPSVAVDGGGNVYVVWADGDRVEASLDGRVRLSVSTNRGQSWSSPMNIHELQPTSLFPSVTAGAVGKIDVAYYVAQNPAGVDVGADLGTPVTTWNIEVAQSLNANLSTRRFTRTVAISGFHTGSICTTDDYCENRAVVSATNAPVPFDGRLGDFFRIDSDSAGNAIFAYPKDRSATSGDPSDALVPWVDLMAGRQTDGPVIR